MSNIQYPIQGKKHLHIEYGIFFTFFNGVYVINWLKNISLSKKTILLLSRMLKNSTFALPYLNRF